MTTPTRRNNPALGALVVLFTIFAIPIVIATPFLLSGFIGLK